MKNFISDLKYRHSIIKYANRFGVTRASDHFNVSRSFIYKLLKRFDGSLDSIKPFSKRPHFSPNESKADEYELIKNYHRRNPNTGLVILWLKLRKAGYSRCLTTLYRCLIRLGLKTQIARRMYEYNRFPMKPLGYLSPIEFLDNFNKTH